MDLAPPDNVSAESGLHKMFYENQAQTQIRQKKTLENADLLKGLMQSKELIKKNETETEKILGVMAAR